MLKIPIECVAHVFQCLAGEIKFENLRDIMRAKGLTEFGRNSYYDILWLLYKEQKNIFKDYMENNRKRVLEFYRKRFNVTPDAEGKIDIAISADGCYTKRSYKSVYNSRYCVTFIIECYTSIVIDLEVVEQCQDKSHTDTSEYCSDGKFHGSSGLLEISAAKTLYKRSVTEEGWPFRYLIHVGDGDSAVGHHVCTANIYPGKKIVKEECIFHARKAVKKAIYGVLKEQYKLAHKADGSGITFKKVFKKEECKTYSIRFANLWYFILQKAVHANNHGNSPENITYMSQSLKAIGRHYCDHKDASLDDRLNNYHILCSADFCKFKQKTAEEQATYQCKDHEFYVKQEDDKGNTITECMDAIVKKFDELASEEKMARCTRLLNQNANESIHNRTFGIVRKEKNFSYHHIVFAANLAAHLQNDGHEHTMGRWMQWIDLYTPEMRQHLVNKDNERKRSSSDHHQDKKKSHPKGKKVKDIDIKNVFYESGRHFEDYTPEEVSEFDLISDANIEMMNTED